MATSPQSLYLSVVESIVLTCPELVEGVSLQRTNLVPYLIREYLSAEPALSEAECVVARMLTTLVPYTCPVLDTG